MICSSSIFSKSRARLVAWALLEALAEKRATKAFSSAICFSLRAFSVILVSRFCWEAWTKKS